MEERILGIHHITAIAGNAKRNFDFYTRVLGQRLVKKTVNFDDPGTYHFYFGDETGTPGTILTFFPWQGIQRGRTGTGMATEIVYAVAGDSLKFWEKRLLSHEVKILESGQRFGQSFLTFEDPDGLILTFLEPAVHDNRKPWTTDTISKDVATRGFHSITLSLSDVERTAHVLTDVLGYHSVSVEGNRHLYVTDAISGASSVELLESPSGARAINAGGTIHHVAFRVRDEETLMQYRKKVIEYGLQITPKIDRNYFYSLYFREPGGVLFEIATDNPGFATDEAVEKLGTSLKLPPQYESNRAEIERVLPPLNYHDERN